MNRVQRLVRPFKAGHAGTLDPLATGVLVVCIGQATRLISYVQDQSKSYQAKFLLGRTSPSEDIETEISEIQHAPVPTCEEIQAAIPQFIGNIEQLPPAYSALKVNGKRAYKLAREGKPVELEPRSIHIHRLEIVDYDYPELELRLSCSSGTYVRSLGRDLAVALGTGAVMSELIRTKIGPYKFSEAVDLEKLDKDNLSDYLLPPLTALDSLPKINLGQQQIEEIRHGRTIPLDRMPTSDSQIHAALGPEGELVALLKPRGKDRFGPTCNFSSQA